jgi:hypothetical protein
LATCLLYGRSEETLEHFLLDCTQLEHLRSTLLLNLIKECSMLLAKYRHSSDFNLLQLIVNPYYYATNSDMLTGISNALFCCKIYVPVATCIFKRIGNLTISHMLLLAVIVVAIFNCLDNSKFCLMLNHMN